MLTIFPLTVWIRVAHPTEQNGQMLGVVFASLIRSSCARAVAGASVTPSPTSPPIAVPAPALAVSRKKSRRLTCMGILPAGRVGLGRIRLPDDIRRSEEHTSELQSRLHLVCRLLLEKKKTSISAARSLPRGVTATYGEA